jgi:hypothetical protein
MFLRPLLIAESKRRNFFGNGLSDVSALTVITFPFANKSTKICTLLLLVELTSNAHKNCDVYATLILKLFTYQSYK